MFEKITNGQQQTGATIIQSQDVSQKNISIQTAAIAIATDGASAQAAQVSHQSNVNNQKALQTAENAPSCIKQDQRIRQKNFNSQGVAFAKSGPSGDDASAIQENSQGNNNIQEATSNATFTATALDPTQVLVDAQQDKVEVNGETNGESAQEDNQGQQEKLDLQSADSITKLIGLDELKITVDLNQDGQTVGIKTNEKGDVTLSEKLEDHPKAEAVAARVSQTGGTVKVVINQAGENLAIEAKETGEIFLNGKKVKISPKTKGKQ